MYTLEIYYRRENSSHLEYLVYNFDKLKDLFALIQDTIFDDDIDDYVVYKF